MMKRNLFLTLAAAFIVSVSCRKAADHEKLTINPLISDHMVVQQEDTAVLWGTYRRSGVVNAETSWGEEASARADASGTWRINLPTPGAGGPYEIIITTRDTSITIHDVLSGEVWLASGQSNMEMPLKGWPPTAPIAHSEEEIISADFPEIRMFTVQRDFELMPVDTVTGEWKVCSPETAGSFSATAYFFARKLHKELGVPVGIIHSSWGGTPVEAWTSREKLLALGAFTDELNALSQENIQQYESWLAQFSSVGIPVNEDDWINLDLEDADYSQPGYDDQEWQTVQLPGMVEDFEKRQADGAFWFRKTFDIPDPGAQYTFVVSGGIDDMDDTYINGKKIGSTQCWNCPRAYTIPRGTLGKGKNTVAIRMIDTGGGGGFKGDILLKDEKGNVIPMEGEWKYRQIAEIYGNRFILFQSNPEAYQNKPADAIPAKINQNTPTVLFNGMIHPLLPCRIKGAIWYQGESNVGRAEQYEKVFPAMINDWRARWKREFPFYFVQIAPFDYGSNRNNLSPALRDAQRKSLTTPKTGMVVTLDIGDNHNIHPADKQDVGLRLALLALDHDYGFDLVSSGPLLKDQKIDGSNIILTFTATGSGLELRDAEHSGFEIAGKDKDFVPAQVVIEGNTVIVSAPSVQNPLFVRYAWSDTATATLFNKEGLPASSFSTLK